MTTLVLFPKSLNYIILYSNGKTSFIRIHHIVYKSKIQRFVCMMYRFRGSINTLPGDPFDKSLMIDDDIVSLNFHFHIGCRLVLLVLL